MSPTELKMQPTIYLERKAGNGQGKYLALRSKRIVGCFFNSVGLIITRESSCKYISKKIIIIVFQTVKRPPFGASWSPARFTSRTNVTSRLVVHIKTCFTFNATCVIVSTRRHKCNASPSFVMNIV
jgi:hypothetical protein